MLTITYINRLGRPEQLTWEMTEEFPEVDEDNSFGIVKIKASGDELVFINYSFENLITTREDVTTWRGDLAYFIYDNLPNAIADAFKRGDYSFPKLTDC